MPQFFFHTINDIDAPPEEGIELASLAEAHLKAISYARGLASAAVGLGRLNLKHRIDIENEQGDVLLTVTFGEAVEVEK